MKSPQDRFIDYIESFTKRRQVHIWLGGSFLRGTATLFSDVDLSVCADADLIKELICGYGRPVFISSTTNPEGILIVIYEDGVAVDLEIIAAVEPADELLSRTDGFFHREEIKKYDFPRDTKAWREISPRDDLPYRVSRLFHRSLIKYLAGKRDVGVSVALEIAAFLQEDIPINEKDYREGITKILQLFEERYTIEEDYRDLLLSLIGMVES